MEDWNTVGFLPKLFPTFFPVGRTSILLGNDYRAVWPGSMYLVSDGMNPDQSKPVWKSISVAQ